MEVERLQPEGRRRACIHKLHRSDSRRGFRDHTADTADHLRLGERQRVLRLPELQQREQELELQQRERALLPQPEILWEHFWEAPNRIPGRTCSGPDFLCCTSRI